MNKVWYLCAYISISVSVSISVSLYPYNGILGFPSGSVVKNPPAMQEWQQTQVQSLGQEDPLEEGMAAHSSILAWRIPWTEEPGGLWSIRPQKWLSTHACVTEYYSAIKDNEIMPLAAAWMDRELIILSEASQNKKHEYHMTSLISEI